MDKQVIIFKLKKKNKNIQTKQKQKINLLNK